MGWSTGCAPEVVRSTGSSLRPPRRPGQVHEWSTGSPLRHSRWPTGRFPVGLDAPTRQDRAWSTGSSLTPSIISLLDSPRTKSRKRPSQKWSTGSLLFTAHSRPPPLRVADAHTGDSCPLGISEARRHLQLSPSRRQWRPPPHPNRSRTPLPTEARSSPGGKPRRI